MRRTTAVPMDKIEIARFAELSLNCQQKVRLPLPWCFSESVNDPLVYSGRILVSFMDFRKEIPE
jgi:hypothetical protein